MALVKTKPMLTLPWIVIHVALGIAAAQSSFIAQLWSVGILVIGCYQIVRYRNKNEEAALWSAYMAASDVVLRACGGTLFWEIGKWGVLLFLVLGMIVQKNKKTKIPTAVWIMLLLLIPGVIMSFTWSTRIRQDITFNLSGMLCLLTSMAYFFKRPLKYSLLKKLFSYSLFPIVSLCVLLLFRTPDIDEIVFNSQANFQTSGGFGPNQVATILGYGWMIVFLMLFLNIKLTFNKVLSILLFAFILYRSLFTFSRGGNLAAILAFVSFMGVLFIYTKGRFFSNKIWMLLLLLTIGVLIINNLEIITGGMFEYRFTGKNTRGEVQEDITSGRLEVLKSEIYLFKNNPLGVGVGGSTYYRMIIFKENVASHNEFGRLLSEHGVFGIVVIFIMLLSPLSFCRKLHNVKNKAYCIMFLVFCIASMMHSGCRTALPEFLYGLCFVFLKPNYYVKNTLYRQQIT